MQLQTAIKYLGLDPNDLSKEALTKQYRKLSRQHHPDTGGTNEEFLKLQEARALVAEYLKTYVKPTKIFHTSLLTYEEA